MAIQPVLTFRSNTTPFSVLNSITYQTTFYSLVLPVLSDEPSDYLSFRIYNNFALTTNIAPMINVKVYCQDGPAVSTASTSPVSSLWFHIFETVYGESVGASYYHYSTYMGADTVIGNSANLYIPETGSDGSSTPTIRAGSNGAGWGFIEFKSRATVPTGVLAKAYTPAIVGAYQWTT